MFNWLKSKKDVGNYKEDLRYVMNEEEKFFQIQLVEVDDKFIELGLDRKFKDFLIEKGIGKLPSYKDEYFFKSGWLLGYVEENKE